MKPAGTASPGAYRRLYDSFNAPVTAIDCGTMCAPHNPSGKPFCCDICHSVPAAYQSEWVYLRENTDLWHEWRQAECNQPPGEAQNLREQTPAHMLLLACQGPAHCQRPFRALSCRQFPFFPYLTSAGRFIGLAYDWEFEPVCWVISNLAQVTAEFRGEFVSTFDRLLADWGDDFKAYYLRSEQMRAHFSECKRRIPLLHRDGSHRLISPNSERMQRVSPERLPKFGPYAAA